MNVRMIAQMMLENVLDPNGRPGPLETFPDGVQVEIDLGDRFPEHVWPEFREIRRHMERLDLTLTCVGNVACNRWWWALNEWDRYKALVDAEAAGT